MPKLDGFEVAGASGRRPGERRCAGVAQSGRGQDEDRRRTAEAGSDDHIVKPIDPRARGADATLRRRPARRLRARGGGVADGGGASRRRRPTTPSRSRDRQHEQHAEPEQPAVRRDDPRAAPDACIARGGDLHQVLQIVLREHEQRRADDRAVHRAHAADDDDQQDVDHDARTTASCRARCSATRARSSAPATVATSAPRHARERCGDDGARADGLGAEVVLADRCSTRPN